MGTQFKKAVTAVKSFGLSEIAAAPRLLLQPMACGGRTMIRKNTWLCNALHDIPVPFSGFWLKNVQSLSLSPSDCSGLLNGEKRACGAQVPESGMRDMKRRTGSLTLLIRFNKSTGERQALPENDLSFVAVWVGFIVPEVRRKTHLLVRVESCLNQSAAPGVRC